MLSLSCNIDLLPQVHSYHRPLTAQPCANFLLIPGKMCKKHRILKILLLSKQHVKLGALIAWTGTRHLSLALILAQCSCTRLLSEQFRNRIDCDMPERRTKRRQKSCDRKTASDPIINRELGLPPEEKSNLKHHKALRILTYRFITSSFKVFAFFEKHFCHLFTSFLYYLAHLYNRTHNCLGILYISK